MKLKYKFLTASVLVFLFFFSQMIILSPQEVSAAQPTVILSGVKGEVIVKKGGGLRELPAVNGMELVQGDWLRTGKAGMAKLIYPDGTEATLGSNSTLNIQRLTTSDRVGVSVLSETGSSASSQGQQSSLQLWAGSVWSKVKSLVNLDDEYEVETPTAVMGVRGTLYLVSVNPENGSTQGDVIDGVVGVSQNIEATQAAPIQLVTMGRTLRLVSLSEPLPNQQVISSQELIKTTQPEILVQLINDILERTKELVILTKEQQQAFSQTGNVEDIKSAVGTSYKLDELTSFSKEFMASLETSDKLEEINQVLVENNQSLDQLRSTTETLRTETEQLRTEVVETAEEAGVSQEEIEDIGNQAVGVPPSAGSVPPPPTPLAPPPTPPLPPVTTPDPSNGGGGSNSGGSSSSSDTTVLSTNYLVSSSTISNVSYATSRASFLANLAKGESHQSWDTSGVHDPVLNNDRIVMTAQNNTPMIYTISVASAPLSALVPISQGQPITFTNGVNLDFGDLTIPSGAQVRAEDVSSSVGESIPEGMALAGGAVNFTLSGMGTGLLEAPVSLIMPLNGDVDPAQVGVYYLNGSAWDYQDSAVRDGTVVAQVNHFSIYAVLSREDPVNLLSQSVSSDGTQIKLSFDQSLHSSSKPETTDFSITSNGTRINVLSVAVDNKSLYLDLEQPIRKNDHVKISYSVGPYHIRDLEGNSVRDFSNRSALTDFLPGPRVVMNNPGTETVQEITVYFYNSELSAETLSLQAVDQVIKGSQIILNPTANPENPIGLGICEIAWGQEVMPTVETNGDFGQSLSLTLSEPYTFSTGDTIDIHFVRGAVKNALGEVTGAAETELVIPSPPRFTVNRDNVVVQGIAGAEVKLYRWGEVTQYGEPLSLDANGQGNFSDLIDLDYYLVQTANNIGGMPSDRFFAGPSSRVIAGVISLPEGSVALRNIHVYLNTEGNDYNAWTKVNIKKSTSSTPYFLTLPANQSAEEGYRVFYHLNSLEGYFPVGWYAGPDRMTLNPYLATEVYFTSEGNHEIDLTLMKELAGSTPPLEEDIDVTTNLDAEDSVTVRGLAVGDLLRIYDAPIGGSLLGEATVNEAENSTTVSGLNLGYDAGSIWVTVTNLGLGESSLIQKDFAAELLLSAAVTPITTNGAISRVRVTIKSSASDHFVVIITDQGIDTPDVGDPVPTWQRGDFPSSSDFDLKKNKKAPRLRARCSAMI